MSNDFTSAIRPAIVMTLLFGGLLGIAYPLAITGVAQVALPSQANGSLVRDGDRVVGSSVVGQAFASERYFNSRPSAAGKGYDGLASSGSNLGPAAQALTDRVSADVATARAGGIAGPLPADMVTTSASGLDPDISPENALLQVPRVAKARGIDEAKLRALVEAAVDRPLVPFLGDPHVNLLALNRQLDAMGATPAK